MLNDLGITVTEIILFENLKQTAKTITDLEELNEDRWTTIAYLFKKLENLKQSFKNLHAENNGLAQTNENLTKVISKLSEKYSQIVED